MCRSQRFWFWLLLILPVSAFAQQNSVSADRLSQSPLPASDPGPSADGTEGRIRLDVVVTDKAGKPVSGLQMKDFTLLDDNQAATVRSFHAFNESDQKPDPPVEVILVIDTINFPIQIVAFTRQEIEKFLRRNDGKLAQPLSFLVLTNEGLDTQRAFSTDGKALAAEVSQFHGRLRTIGGAASVNGAIELFKVSVDALYSILNNEAKKPGRKLLIWSDGGWPLLDRQSTMSSPEARRQYFRMIVQLSTRLREARISVCSISTGETFSDALQYQGFLQGVKSPEKAGIPNLGLKVLALQSGGRVLGPSNDMAGQIDGCVRDASNFYSISFDPPRAEHADEYHDLKVQIDQPGLTARTSTGYYNQP